MLVVTHQRKIADHHMDTNITERSVKLSVKLETRRVLHD